MLPVSFKQVCRKRNKKFYFWLFNDLFFYGHAVRVGVVDKDADPANSNSNSNFPAAAAAAANGSAGSATPISKRGKRKSIIGSRSSLVGGSRGSLVSQTIQNRKSYFNTEEEKKLFHLIFLGFVY